jgi:multiple sugar transport system substrate-binding protein
MQGRAAMWLDGIGFATPLEDPTKSRIVGKVGYGVTPPGPKAHHAGMFADGMGISRGVAEEAGRLALYPVHDQQGPGSSRC